MLWTPLLLICKVDALDCAIPSAPAYPTEQACIEAIQGVIERWQLPENMIVVGSTCYNWGAQS
jgi:hypothetical protein